MESTLKDKLEQLAVAIEEQACLAQKAEPWADEEKRLRAEILAEMQAGGVKTMTGGGLMATEVVTKDVRVVDDHALRSSLFEIGKLDQCTKTTVALVMPEVRKLAKDFNLSGLEPTESRTLRIKPLEATS